MKWFIKVLRHYADFSGRARRKEYWMFTLFNIIFFYVWMFLAALLAINAGRDVVEAIPEIYLSYFIVMALPGLAVTVRRLHDTGKSGWMLLIGLIPLIGGIWLLVLMVTDGQESENRYGQNPKTSAATFGEQKKLKSAGITLTVVAVVAIISFMANIFFLYFYHSVDFWHFGRVINLLAYIMLMVAGIFLLDGTTISEIKGKTRNAMLLLLVASVIFFLLNVVNVSTTGRVEWIGILFLLSAILFTICNLYTLQNKDLIRKAAIAVMVFSALDFLWFSYNRISSNMHIDDWARIFFLFFALVPVAYIVLAAAFYPPKAEIQHTKAAESPADTKPQKAVETLDTPKPMETAKGFTLANLEKVRINTKVSDILAMFGEPDFKMPAEAAFAMFGATPASERGKEYWTYKTPYGDLQVAIKDNSHVVSSRGLEYIVEQMKEELPEEKPDAADIEKILKEDIRFSIASFQPVVTPHGFTKEEVYHMLENYLAGNRPQKMSNDETELLKPLFMNLLIHFRNEACLYLKSGRNFGGICDACNGSIGQDEFYLMGSWARCRKCALKAVVSNLDWNYYLGHITNAIGEVPAPIVSQAYDIKDKIIKRRQV